jgi:hypothetical protein
MDSSGANTATATATDTATATGTGSDTVPATGTNPATATDWPSRAALALRARHTPTGVSAATHTDAPTPADPSAPATRRLGRFGPLFGETVHLAIGHALRSGLAPGGAVARARLATRLDLHDAAADTARALDALAALGLHRRPGPDLRLEYPVAGRGENGTLLLGYIDLVGNTADGLVLVDFKTDTPGPYPAYLAQIRTYARLLGDRPVRAGLLFTADGSWSWLNVAP